MNAKYFLDSNIFVYSFDNKSPAKQKKSQALIEQALADNLGVISSQVIQEFCNVALRKFEKPFSVKDCKNYMEQVLNPLCGVFASIELYRLALDTKEETGYSFYDSVILASAIQSGCKTMYSEDFQSGQRISNLTIQNPF